MTLGSFGGRSLNAEGTVLFVGIDSRASPGLYTGKGGSILTSPGLPSPGDGTNNGSINNAGAIAMVAYSFGGGPYNVVSTASGTVEIVARGDAVGFTTGSTAVQPLINNRGSVVFQDNPNAPTPTSSPFSRIFLARDGGVQLLASGDPNGSSPTNPYSFVDRAALNDRDEIAFVGILKAGGTQLVTGSGPLFTKVLGTGDPLDGSTVSNIFRSVGLNTAGQLSFEATLADGRTGIYRADPFTEPLPVAPDTTLSRPGDRAFEFVRGTGDFRTRPTVVITHGWQPGDTYPGKDQTWWNDMAAAVKRRAPDANVLTFTWSGAFTLNPGEAAAKTQGFGSALAKRLLQELGPDYVGQIQFIGHSYGNAVNASAVQELDGLTSSLPALRFRVSQFTILDSPPPFGSTFFDLQLPLSRVTWVDNYFGNGFGFSLTPAVGLPISGAYNVLVGGADHLGVRDYYGKTIPSSTIRTPQGFDYSMAVGGFDARPSPRSWIPVTITEVISTISEVVASSIKAGWRIASGVIESVVDGLLGAGQYVLKLFNSSTSSAVTEVAVPFDADFLRLNLLFADPGDGNWLALYFNDTLLFSFLGTDFSGTDYVEYLIPINEFRGQTGDLWLFLNASGDADAEARVGGLAFIRVTEGQAQVPFASTWWLLVVGLVTLGLCRRSYLVR